MQKFTTSLFLLILSIAAVRAQDVQRMPAPQKTKLSISSFNNSGSLRITVDGQAYNTNHDADNNDFVLTNLAPGTHSIRVWQMPARTRGAMSSNAIRVIYEGTVYLRGGYYTDIYINRFNHAMKDEQPISGADIPNYPVPNQPHPGYNPVMSAESFNALKTTLRNESFDNSRLNIAKQAASSNFFSVAQVKEVMQLFSYDESRLDIAKSFYPRVTDKQNYFMLNDAFSFSSSKDALSEFLRQNP